MTSYGTMTTSANGYTWSLSAGANPERTPAGIIVTRAVETRKGWRGQVIVDKEILHETRPFPGEEGAARAQKAVNAYVVARIKSLFAPRTVDHSDTEG